MSDAPIPTCLNCETELRGPYCHRCGQKDQHKRVPLRHLLHDVMHDLWHFDTKVLSMLWLLVRRPGFLAGEYLEGRRARYVPPFRLYVVVSFITFALLGMVKVGDTVKAGSKVETATTVEVDVDRSSTAKKAQKEEATQWAKDMEKDIRAKAEQKRSQRMDEAKAGNSGRGINISSSSGFGKELDRRVRKAAEDPAALYRIFLGGLSKVMFLLMPAFAGILYLLHARRGSTFFVDHMVLSLHFHTLAFLTIIGLRGLSLLPLGCWGCLPWGLLLMAPPVWLTAALQYLHRRGWVRSALKTSLLMGIYGLALGASLLAVLWYSLPK